jgi:hypothetical protein
MRNRQLFLGNGSQNSPRSLQPVEAWLALLMLILGTAIVLLTGFGTILNLAFPAGALAVGAFLYWRYPLLYNSFIWWMWLLTPLIRRLADYQSRSFTDPSPILLTPYLVTFLCGITVLRSLPKIHRQGGLPFIFAIVSLLYGFLVGLIYREPIAVGIALLDWLPPVLYGFYVFVNWQDYPHYRQNIQRVCTWSVLLLGIYGIIQYLVLPEWDKFWLINAPISSIGNPEPMQFRPWSTLNSSEPFAAFMAAALLLLFSHQNPLSFSATVVGYLIFLLAAVRSAWGGWLAGFLTLITALKPIFQIRLILTILVIVLMVTPLVGMEQFSAPITERLETFSNLEADRSASVRQANYQKLIAPALQSFFGQGLGGPKHDSTILAMLFDLGWLGSLFYLGGLLLLLMTCFQGVEVRFDPFLATARAAIISVLVRIPLNSSLLGISGLLLWGLIGISLGAQKYYRYQPYSKVTHQHE